MERYFKSVKKATVKSVPYPPRTSSKLDEDKQRWSKFSAPLSAGGKKPSSSTITKHLLNTLSDSSNPITHSSIYDRSDTVVVAAAGHQRGEGRTPYGTSAKAHVEDRSSKLSLQRRDVSDSDIPKGVLGNVRIYIDGYLSGTTDTELKRLVAHAGGTILFAPSGATHIVTSRQLNASKTHKIMTTKSKSRNPVHVVKPEWVTDSIAAGRRLPESCYTLLRSSGTRVIVDMLKSGRSS